MMLGTAQLDRADQEELKLIADQIVDNELIDRVTIVGHAFQESGVTSVESPLRSDREKNRARDAAVLTELGRRRAEAVRDFLLLSVSQTRKLILSTRDIDARLTEEMGMRGNGFCW